MALLKWSFAVTQAGSRTRAVLINSTEIRAMSRIFRSAHLLEAEAEVSTLRRTKPAAMVDRRCGGWISTVLYGAFPGDFPGSSPRTQLHTTSDSHEAPHS